MEDAIELLIGEGLSRLAGELRDLTLQIAKQDYEKLRTTKCNAINEASLVGNKAMDYFFFSHRLRTKTAKGISFPDWLKTDEYKKPYYQRFIKKATDRGISLIRAKYAAFRLYSGSGTISAFKPIIARKLYCKYNPTTILDFSAGWGGRCLAAMSLDKNYIGFDTNKTLKSAYAGMLKAFPTDGKISIHFQDSSKVDYSKYDYDMVFTSPPYFKKTKPTERYEKMPEYKDRDDFNERFLFPVVMNTYKHLKSGGTYALNIPIDMYDDVKKVLGKSNSKIPLKIASRSKETKQGGEYKEYIYVWKKMSGGGKSDINLPKATFKNEYISVKKSSIPNAGNGVFAKTFIKKGTKIVDYMGKFMSYDDYNKKYRLPDGKVDTRYTYRMDTRSKQPGMIVAKDKPYLTNNPVNYINEGKPVNVELKKKALYAKVDIDKGDELFLQYPKTYDRYWLQS